MSIATELTNLNDNILDAYDAVQDKGGTVPANKNMVNLPTAIDSIPSGGSNPYDIHMNLGSTEIERGDPTARTVNEPFLPSNITKIAKHAFSYAYQAQTQVGSERRGTNFGNITEIGHGGLSHAFSDYFEDGSLVARGAIKDINFDNLVTVDNYGLDTAYAYNLVENISFPELTTVEAYGLSRAFYNSSAANVVASFPKVTSVGSHAFDKTFALPNGQNKGVVSADFSALTQITTSGSYAFNLAFQNNKTLTSVDFTSLETVQGPHAFSHAFENCISLTDTSCFSGLKEILAPGSTTSGGEFEYCFTGCSGLQTVSFPELTTLTSRWDGAFQYAFSGCTSLTTASFAKLTEAAPYSFRYAFNGCTSLTSFSAPLLQAADSNTFDHAFDGCTALTTVSFPELTSFGINNTNPANVFSYAFSGCTSLTTVSFPSLSSMPCTGSTVNNFNYAFYRCTSLTSVSFPALTSSSFGSSTSHFNNMLKNCSGVTVHFPAAIQSTIGSWSSVTNGFGGTNTTVLFDL